MVAATAKAFNISFEYVLHEMSWQNMSLYCATLPTYNDKKEQGQKKEEGVLNADKEISKEQLAQLQKLFG